MASKLNGKPQATKLNQKVSAYPEINFFLSGNFQHMFVGRKAKEASSAYKRQENKTKIGLVQD